MQLAVVTVSFESLPPNLNLASLYRIFGRHLLRGITNLKSETFVLENFWFVVGAINGIVGETIALVGCTIIDQQ